MLPRGLEITHRFRDRFIGISPPKTPGDPEGFFEQPLISLASTSESGRQLDRWIAIRNPEPNVVMRTDSFDLIVNLVSLGFGNAVVPLRALAAYGKRKPVQRSPFECPFERELIVVARRDRSRPPHLGEFINRILF